MQENTELEGFAARLSELCGAMKLPERGRQTSLAKQFGVTPKAARKWLLGMGYPEMEIVIAMARWGEVNVEWLLTGRGPKNGTHVDTRDLVIGEMMRSLPATTRHEVVEFLAFKISRGVPSLAREEQARYLAALDTFKKP